MIKPASSFVVSSQKNSGGVRKSAYAGMLAGSFILWLLLVYMLHVPLPARMTERTKLTVLDTTMRFLYKYPVTALGWLGGSYAQVLWQRHSLRFYGRLLGSWLPTPLLQTHDISIADVPVRVHVPTTQRHNQGAIVFVHGGGFSVGDVGLYDTLTRDLALRSQMVVMSVEYRLSPEHAYPIPLNDVDSVVRALLNGTITSRFDVDANKLVLMGDSAGANLVTVVARRLRDTTPLLPSVVAQVLIYPLVQFHDMQMPSYQIYYNEYADTAFVDPESIARAFLFYAGVPATRRHVDAMVNNNHTKLWHSERLAHHKLPRSFVHTKSYKGKVAHQDIDTEIESELLPYLSNVEISPLISDDLYNLPPAMVVTCEFDLLRDEGYLYAEHLRSFGVPVLYRNYEHGFHAMLNLHKELSLAQQIIDDVIVYVQNVVGGFEY